MNTVLPSGSPTPAMLFAVSATLATLLLMPFTALTGRHPTPLARRPTIDTVALIPPPEPPEQRLEPPDEAPAESVAHLEMVMPVAQPLPVQPVFDLGLDLGEFSGTLQTRFPVAVDGLGGAMDQAIFSLDALDQPPQPVVQLKPVYPAFARARGIEGAVTIEFVVDSTGVTRDAEIVASDPSGVFDQAARQAIERWRFNPGIRRGEPVAVRVRQRVTFSIE